MDTPQLRDPDPGTVPAHVIEKGIPTAGLLALVLINKFADHLSLYRQEQLFGLAGLAIPRSTLGAWIGACGVQLQPLVDALRQDMLKQAVLHADETPVQMLSPAKGRHIGRMRVPQTFEQRDEVMVRLDAVGFAGLHERIEVGGGVCTGDGVAKEPIRTLREREGHDKSSVVEVKTVGI